jgi:hypothetical protein
MASRFSLRLPTETTRDLRRRLRHDQDVPGGRYADDAVGIDPALLINDASLVCVMFLESEVPTDDRVAGRGGRLTNETSVASSLFSTVLDALVRNFQPAPHMLHAELLLVSATGECRHFATYVGDEARWRDRGAEYYRIHRWRGIPLDGGDGVPRIAAECDAEVGTAYSLARYALSTPLFGWASRAVRKRTHDPAHCGALTARVVQNALGARGEALLPLASTRYSPSDLYNGLCAGAGTMDFDGADAMLRDEELGAAAGLLLTGTDAEVRRLGGRKRAEALKTLAVRMNVALADPRGISEAQRTHHARALGWAATRVADSVGGGDEVVLGGEAAPIGAEGEGEGADGAATVEGVVWSPGSADEASPLPRSP